MKQSSCPPPNTDERQRPRIIAASVLAAWLIMLVMPFSCRAISRVSFEKKTYKNFKGAKKRAEIAILRERGYRFWLQDAPVEKDKEGHPIKKRYDELRLGPGQYMIGFVRTTRRVGGAAFCSLRAGRVYSFKVVDRQYLPKSGVYGFIGKCFFDPEREENKNLPRTKKEEKK